MYYYHFVVETLFTEHHYFLESKKPLTQKEIDEQYEEFRIEDTESYSYMAEEDDYSEDDYYEDCSCYCEEITDPEEWEELKEQYE